LPNELSVACVIALLTNSLSYQQRGARGVPQGFAAGAKTMGTVVAFPAARRAERASERQIAEAGATATIMILPVIRIERMSDTPDDGLKRPPAGRRRRRRARQS